MSSKKIGYYPAQTIARKVAAKVFEHIRNPLQAECDKLAQEAYDNILVYFGLGPRAIKDADKAELINMSSSCAINIVTGVDSDGDPMTTCVTLLGSSNYGEPRNYVSHRLVVPEELSADLSEVWKKLGPVVSAQESLMQRVRGDLEGRTAAAVIKKWPELRGFIEDEMGIQGSGELVVPFADLLHKYLSPFIALPAPQES